MFKKVIAFLMSAGMILSSASFVCADSDITVLYNGETVEFDVTPVIENDRTLVPLRAIFEKMGAVVSWDEGTRTVFSILDNKIVTLQIDNPVIFVNDKQTEIDVPARIVNDRTLVPLRAVSESFDCKVQWDGNTKTVTIER